MIENKKDPLQGLIDTLSDAIVSVRTERDDPDQCKDLLHYNMLCGIITGYQWSIRRVWDAMAVERGKAGPDGTADVESYPDICKPE